MATKQATPVADGPWVLGINELELVGLFRLLPPDERVKVLAVLRQALAQRGVSVEPGAAWSAVGSRAHESTPGPFAPRKA